MCEIEFRGIKKKSLKENYFHTLIFLNKINFRELG